MRFGFGAGLGLSALVIALDQASKWAIVEKVMRPEGVEGTPFYTFLRIELTPFLDLVMTWNRGVSFGIGNGAASLDPLILSALSGVIVLALVGWLYRAGSSVVRLAVALIVGGAVGNIIDRLRYGAVADFIDAHIAGHHWPAFNLADSAITVGAVILVVDSLFGGRDSTKT
ncbi:signal peptidase II [Magnetospirillum molischianum]|uniref:Lipoprotein signal peptidase n=1 Tax=Magnetospirillum molischianum DSM 120 TaxID=1150626 RepID=H8FUL2_MAGML|nr:signal peptidase II [Magnetospirillum molischianum]CCG42050.1 Lipoprotein signal peptidase [Magnetospirillum molischianum DSM 120]